MGLNYVCLRSSRIIVKALGPAALTVTSTIMGIILVALSVELIYMGLLGFGLVPKPV
jgi:small neutral amino acid transporter SnatA (MarC family)